MPNLERQVVYLVDDDEPFRNGLDSLLRSVGLEVASFSAPGEFLAAYNAGHPSCLVLDVRLSGASGLALQKEIAAREMDIPIIFMTGHGDVEMSVAAMKGGAFDFLPKPFREQNMLDAVNAALAKDQERLQREKGLSPLRYGYNSLTSRERQVLDLVLSGLMNKQIASKIHLSEVTVKAHRGQIMKKMGARNIADLVIKATSIGVFPTH
ncbi:response regulator transcription factor [Silvimonas amylolytica]|nr:response regulator [Silvimonas amylolytica]